MILPESLLGQVRNVSHQGGGGTTMGASKPKDRRVDFLVFPEVLKRCEGGL